MPSGSMHTTWLMVICVYVLLLLKPVCHKSLYTYVYAPLGVHAGAIPSIFVVVLCR